MALDEAVIADYPASLTAGDTLPPVVAFFDGADFWLADRFHRYHAYHAAGVDEVLAEVRTGSKRDAVLFSVGANAAHGLRRSNADKRRAVETLLADAEWSAWSDNAIAKAFAVSRSIVESLRKASLAENEVTTPGERTYTTKHGTTATMLLNDAEWAAWSDREIARQCQVSDRFVNGLRAASANGSQIEAGNDAPITPATRTVTRNGTTYEQKTANIGKARQVPAAAFSEPEADVQPAPEVATPRLTPEQGAAAVTQLEALMAENAELREEVDDLKATLAHTLEDNEMMGRVFDADDQVKAAMAEATRQKALVENAERMLSARSQEFNERARSVIHWKTRAVSYLSSLRRALRASWRPSWYLGAPSMAWYRPAPGLLTGW